jgi:co-chaperonin GroES (HSP10)
MSKFKAYGHRVTLEPIKEDQESVVNGLIIPSTASGTWSRAKVLSVGHKDINLKVGDIVLYDSFRSVDLSPNVIIVASDSIVATVTI